MEHAVGALANLAANNPGNKVAIASAGGIEPLVALALDGTDSQKQNAAGGLANLAGDPGNQVAIATAGGIKALVALARGGTAVQKQYAAVALKMLASNKANTVAIHDAGWTV